jgi:hypothetical protein
MAERNEMHNLQEPIGNGEANLAVDARKPLDEVHGHARPDSRWQLVGLNEADQLQVFRLVLLPHPAGTHIILDSSARVWEVEVHSQPMKSLGDAFVSYSVGTV